MTSLSVAPAPPVTLGAGTLTCAEVARLAKGGIPVTLAPIAWERIALGRRAAEELSDRRPIYGRTTGVGANSGVEATDSEHPYRLLASHAAAAGPARGIDRVRATALVRVNQLAAGRAGISPEVVTGLLAMLEQDSFPTVLEWGGLGTGDLGVLAAFGEYLAGRRAASDGRRTTHPIDIGVHDALPLLSSNAATLADAALAAEQLWSLTRSATVVTALVAGVLGGSDEPTSAQSAEAAPTGGAAEAMALLTGLRLGSSLLASRTQDAFHLRCAPQVLGAAYPVVRGLIGTVEAHLNAGIENPMITNQTAGGPMATHQGGFYSLDVALALDSTLLAVSAIAAQSLNRVGALLDPDLSGLPAFLGDGSPAASGAMLLEYVGASALAELRTLATPVTTQVVSLSRGVEDSAPFTSLAARQALSAVPLLRCVLACELVAAVRAARLLEEPSRLGPGLTDLLVRCADLPSELQDRDLSPDLVAAERLLPWLPGDPPAQPPLRSW
ncbi:MAG: aromatic amino acid lyase [Marmoricola sp.]